MKPRLLRRAFLTLAGAGAVVACDGQFDVQPWTPTGVVTVFGASAGGRYVARPEGVFLLAPTPPTSDSRAPSDSCVVAPWAPQTTGPVENLDAGDSIVVTFDGVPAVLRPVNRYGFIQYVLAHDTAGYTPGTAVSVTIPGATDGFPAATIASVMPPAIASVTPVPAQPPTTEPFTVTWAPAGGATYTFELLLLYSIEGIDYDSQIVCSWVDDGQATIPGELLQAWVQTEFQRRVEVTRYRTERQQIGDHILFLLVTFDTLPPAPLP